VEIFSLATTIAPRQRDPKKVRQRRGFEEWPADEAHDRCTLHLAAKPPERKTPMPARWPILTALHGPIKRGAIIARRGTTNGGRDLRTAQALAHGQVENLAPVCQIITKNIEMSKTPGYST